MTEGKGNSTLNEVYEDIYQISIPMKGTPLRNINVYLIKGDDRNLLIDTGYQMDLCIRTIKDSLDVLNVSLEDTDILLTHFHNDHAGASTSIIRPGRTIYVPEPEYRFFAIGSDPEHYTKSRKDIYLKEGISEDFFTRMMGHRNPGAIGPDFFNHQFAPVKNEQEIPVGKYTLKAIHTPGHTPGHMCYWEETHRVLFTGDHVLFGVSPNIIPWEGIPNILSIYMFSLEKLREYPAALVLPAHRGSGDLEKRIDELEMHHQQRLNECESMVKLYPGKTALEITKMLSWKIRDTDKDGELPFSLLRYAFGECLVHLNHLRFLGKISRDMSKDGWYHYI